MKYLLLLPVAAYYLMRDMAMLIKHEDLLRGISLFVLTFLVGIFFSAWLNIAREQSKIRKKLGGNVYEWMANK